MILILQDIASILKENNKKKISQNHFLLHFLYLRIKKDFKLNLNLNGKIKGIQGIGTID